MLPLLALAAGLVVFMVSTDEDPAPRAQTPLAEPRIALPAAAAPQGGESGGAAEGAPRDAGLGIFAGEKEALRAELEGIAQS